jgi:hypothetical protein
VRDISAVCEGYLGRGGVPNSKLCAARTRPVPNFGCQDQGLGGENTDSVTHVDWEKMGRTYLMLKLVYIDLHRAMRKLHVSYACPEPATNSRRLPYSSLARLFRTRYQSQDITSRIDSEHRYLQEPRGYSENSDSHTRVHTREYIKFSSAYGCEQNLSSRTP